MVMLATMLLSEFHIDAFLFNYINVKVLFLNLHKIPLFLYCHIDPVSYTLMFMYCFRVAMFQLCLSITTEMNNQ